MSRARRLSPSGEHTQPNPLDSNAVRRLAGAVGGDLKSFIDAYRAEGKTWDAIAEHLTSASRPARPVHPSQARALAIRLGVDLAPGPRGQGRVEATIPASEPLAAPDRATARTPVRSLARENQTPGTIAHAVAALRTPRRLANKSSNRASVRPRVQRYLTSLNESDRALLLEELLVQKLTPPIAPIETHATNSTSVRTVSGGLPSLGH